MILLKELPLQMMRIHIFGAMAKEHSPGSGEHRDPMVPFWDLYSLSTPPKHSKSPSPSRLPQESQNGSLLPARLAQLSTVFKSPLLQPSLSNEKHAIVETTRLTDMKIVRMAHVVTNACSVQLLFNAEIPRDQRQIPWIVMFLISVLALVLSVQINSNPRLSSVEPRRECAMMPNFAQELLKTARRTPFQLLEFVEVLHPSAMLLIIAIKEASPIVPRINKKQMAQLVMIVTLAPLTAFVFPRLLVLVCNAQESTDCVAESAETQSKPAQSNVMPLAPLVVLKIASSEPLLILLAEQQQESVIFPSFALEIPLLALEI